MKRVLIVEEESLIRQSLSHVILKDGWAVTTTSDIEEAKNIAKNGRYDLVITDISPKNMREVMNLIYVTKKASQGTKIMVLTAYLEDEIKQAAMLGNINVFCAKPFDLSEMRNAVKCLLNEDVAALRQ